MHHHVTLAHYKRNPHSCEQELSKVLGVNVGMTGLDFVNVGMTGLDFVVVVTGVAVIVVPRVVIDLAGCN